MEEIHPDSLEENSIGNDDDSYEEQVDEEDDGE